MNRKITVRPTARTVRAIMVAGIALSVVGGSSALVHAQSGPARSADESTMQACFEQQPTLSHGSTGDCVYVAQKILSGNGFRGTPLDGIFGPATEQIVREFQEASDIDADGVIGGQTWTALIGSPGY